MGDYEGTSSLPGASGAISDAETKIRWSEHNDFDARSPGGESLNDMRRRFLPFVKRATENYGGDPGILVMVTHGGILIAKLQVQSAADQNVLTCHGLVFLAERHISLGLRALVLREKKHEHGSKVCVAWFGKRACSSSFGLRFLVI